MKIRYAAKTDVGMKRTHNEDYFSLIEDEQLFLVADGMGGHASGEVASKMAAETIGEFYQRTREDEDATWPYKMDRSLSYIENRLVCSIKLANLRIFETSNRDLRYKGMGTTIVSTLVSGDKIYVGHEEQLLVFDQREVVLVVGPLHAHVCLGGVADLHQFPAEPKVFRVGEMIGNAYAARQPRGVVSRWSCRSRYGLRACAPRS